MCFRRDNGRCRSSVLRRLSAGLASVSLSSCGERCGRGGEGDRESVQWPEPTLGVPEAEGKVKVQNPQVPLNSCWWSFCPRPAGCKPRVEASDSEQLLDSGNLSRRTVCVPVCVWGVLRHSMTLSLWCDCLSSSPPPPPRPPAPSSPSADSPLFTRTRFSICPCCRSKTNTQT